MTTNHEWAQLALKAVEPLGVRLSLYPRLPPRSWLVGKLRTMRRPFSYSIASRLEADVSTEIERGYDVLHLEQIWAGYLAGGHARSLVAIHHLSCLDLSGLKLGGSTRLLLERHLIRRAEVKLLQHLPAITTVSERLAGAIRSTSPRAKVFVVPFGLDPSLYTFTAQDRTSEPVIGFLANLGWMPGYLAAHRLITSIFPLVRRLVPGAQLLVAGWDAREALAEFVDNPGVTVVSNVREAESYFARLQVLAYPVPQGSGVKVKVLEAMAWGVPVVTTTDGVEGIEAVDGEHCFVADEDATFAQQVIDLLQHAELRRGFRERARALIEAQHSPDPVVSRLEQVYDLL